MAEMTKDQALFLEAFNSSVEDLGKYSNVVLGWPDEEHGITHANYLEDVEEYTMNVMSLHMHDVEHGGDMPSFTVHPPSFEEWKKSCREANQERDDLGYRIDKCELCGDHWSGNRYAATALPQNPSEDKGYIALSICGACLQYIANGELPGE